MQRDPGDETDYEGDMTEYKDEGEARAAGLKPGEIYYKSKNVYTWVQWTKEDLKDQELIQFVPLQIPNQRHYHLGDGKIGYILDVNNLKCLLRVGEINVVHKMFYDTYKNNLDQMIELEKFKRTGPESAPWTAGGPWDEATGKGKNTWFYKPEASAWLDENGQEMYGTQDGKFIVGGNRYWKMSDKGLPLVSTKLEYLLKQGTKSVLADLLSELWKYVNRTIKEWENKSPRRY